MLVAVALKIPYIWINFVNKVVAKNIQKSSNLVTLTESITQADFTEPVLAKCMFLIKGCMRGCAK